MSEHGRGFDPSRLTDTRPGDVVQQLLAPDAQERAQGFTEVKVIGVGGAGGNTVNRMVEAGVEGIDFAAVNCDLQALDSSHAHRTIPIGQKLTRGLGSGGNVRLGLQAAEQDADTLKQLVEGADMVFVTAGMGGGTGSGAAPYIACLARAAHALTVGVVTRPFPFEGRRRQEISNTAISELRANVDALIVVSNERLLRDSASTKSFLDAFRLADDTLHQGITGIANLIVVPGLINLDFADVCTVMTNSGAALMALGTGAGENRAQIAAQSAIESPLLEGSISGARGMLLNITGGPDLTLHDVQALVELLGNQAAPDAQVIVGATIHPGLTDKIRVTLIATGLG